MGAPFVDCRRWRQRFDLTQLGLACWWWLLALGAAIASSACGQRDSSAPAERSTHRDLELPRGLAPDGATKTEEFAQRGTPHSTRSGRVPEVRNGEMLVRLSAAELTQAETLAARLGFVVVRQMATHGRLAHWFLLQFPTYLSLPDALSSIRSQPGVERAQPNYVYRLQGPFIPDDTRFVEQWALHNTGQVPVRDPLPGRPGSDVDWPEAWELVQAEPPATEVIVAVMDSGVDYTHPDLDAVIWTNPGEIAGNLLDDDGNGFIDDVHGYDFYADDPEPLDEDGHGTHIAGIIGAEVNNALGIAGVARPVRIMALRVLGPDGGDSADALLAVDYALRHGARILNNSWGTRASDDALLDAVAASADADASFVAAAGNQAVNADVVPLFPAAYDNPHVISVAATDSRDRSDIYSNWGAASVDLGAPGRGLVSTAPGGGYGKRSGTSFAAPMVSGALALARAMGLGADAASLATLLFDSVEPLPDLGCRSTTGGRLNLHHLLLRGLSSDDEPPGPPRYLQLANAGSQFASLNLLAPAAAAGERGASRYEVRLARASDWSSFDAADSACGGWRPRPGGQSDLVTVTGLEPATRYSVQMRAVDRSGNRSELSERLSFETEPPRWLLREDAEDAASDWTVEADAGAGWSRSEDFAYAGARSWASSPGFAYAPDSDHTLTSPLIDLTARARVALSFWHLYELDSSGDVVSVEVAVEGEPFVPLVSFTGASGLWQHVAADLDAYAGSRILLRFRLRTDATGSALGWLVDDIVVSALPAQTTLNLSDSMVDSSNWLLQGRWTIEAEQLRGRSEGVVAGSLAAASLKQPFDLRAGSDAQVSFLLQHELEIGRNFLLLEVSTDGEFWRWLARYTGRVTDAYRARVDLSEYAGYPEVWLRFVLMAVDDVTVATVAIDEVRVVQGGDRCPLDAAKALPGICGCGVADVDGDGDGTLDCRDQCPGDPSKFAPGVCGCGVPDVVDDADGGIRCPLPPDSGAIDAGRDAGRPSPGRDASSASDAEPPSDALAPDARSSRDAGGRGVRRGGLSPAGGCGCRLASHGGGAGGWLAALALATVAMRRRSSSGRGSERMPLAAVQGVRAVHRHQDGGVHGQMPFAAQGTQFELSGTVDQLF